MKKTRITALVLALVLAFTTLPLSALAASYTAYVKSGSTLNLRTVPTKKNNTPIAQLKGGTKVTVKSTANGWSKITWNHKTGYVMSSFLTKTAPTAKTSTSKDVRYVSTVQKRGLNFRTGPSDSYSIIRVVHDGAKVTVLGNAGGGWLKVSYGGKTGYMYAKYLKK